MNTIQEELSNTCATMVRIDYDGDTISDIHMLGGCHGLDQLMRNIVKLFRPNAKSLYNTFSSIRCGRKGTSCTNEIAKVLAKHFKGIE